ncbi:MAG TPA: hypothetical protein VHY21_09105 [Pseudonocardiaceae bacterium]|nr:hypothetical protein [Pseudonocardiaceae bacterium]
MAPDKLRKTLRQGQQLLADIPVQLAAIRIRRKLRAHRFAVRRALITTPRPPAVLSSTVFTPVATPTRYPLAVRAALRRPLPCGATAHHPAPALAPVAVRISGRIRSG